MVTMPDRDERLAALTALAEPLRRRLYLLVASAEEPVSRDGAAAALGLARSVAAFHLDKLAEVGLLDVEFQRPEGRRGPGAGRPAKLYRPAEHDFTFTVPERRYEVAASLFAQALEGIGDDPASALDLLKAAARDRGRAMGRASSQAETSVSAETPAATEAPAGNSLPLGTPPPPGTPPAPEPVPRLLALLSDHAYEPRRTGDVITLENCPFRALAREHRELVCGMNLALVAGLLDSVEASDVSARLDPAPGRCCVTLVTG
jgi:predicted ArsR family transcriptional regulator